MPVLDRVPRKELRVNSIPAQEIKRRGIAAVDEVIGRGDLHVIRNNRPQYVVLSEERYQELVAAEQEASYARLRRALEDVQAGRVKAFKTADDLLNAMDEEE
jgi:PHD/YefM family antitoxin component YafN of YafNO toxin-antitoxin module